MELARIRIKKWWQHCQAGTTVDTAGHGRKSDPQGRRRGDKGAMPNIRELSDSLTEKLALLGRRACFIQWSNTVLPTTISVVWAPQSSTFESDDYKTNKWKTILRKAWLQDEINYVTPRRNLIYLHRAAYGPSTVSKFISCVSNEVIALHYGTENGEANYK